MAETAGSVASVVSAVLDVGKCLAAPFGRHFMYLYNYKSNFENLEKEVGKLNVVRDQVNRKVSAAQNNMEEINQNVKDWQENVNSTLDEADKLIQTKANNRCLKGLCPNLITRYKHGREASKKVKAVAELLMEGGTFGEVSHPTTHEDIRLTNNDYEPFESRRSTLDDVLEALENANVDMIGVYGMGGIGKTTLVKEVGKQAKARKLFDEVIFVEVTDTPDIIKIQGEIADKLGLKFDKETRRADKLCARLKKGEKILVILDNIWEQLDLMTIGVPSGANHGGCKLLLTTRNLSVLSSMDSTKNILMGVLNEGEAWDLFGKMAGDVIKIRELQSLPNDVCEKCGGLPIAIVTVAKALKNKRHPYQWKDALRRLKSPSPANFTGDLEKPYLSIQLSYNYLRGEELKKTFLLCSLMGHDASVLDLVKYVMGLDIFQGIYTMAEARPRVYTLIQELKDSCLLLNGQTSESFSMHDFVREVTISIANQDDHVFYARNKNTWEWPSKDRLQVCKKIFIRDSTMSKLPGGLEYSQLECFFLNNKVLSSYNYLSTDKDSLFEIPDKFFTGMVELKVLDLNGIQLLSLRSSLHLLINLQTLSLDFSHIEDVATIGELKKLKILSLRGSNVEQLPREIGQLTQLRLLDLRDCRKLKVITPNVLSSLFLLEELYMSRCSVLWEAEGHNVERSNASASLAELKHLPQLTTLEIDIQDEKILPNGLFSKKLDKYKISIGDGSYNFGGPFIGGEQGNAVFLPIFRFNENMILRTLKLKLNSIIYSEVLQGFKNVEFLCLDKLQGVKNVLYELDKEGFSQLKHLQIHNNPNLLSIVDSTKRVPHEAFPAFPLLESLILVNLINLEKIWDSQLPTMSSCYQNLTSLVVSDCRKLKYVFPSSMVERFKQLQHLEIVDCRLLKEIVAKGRGEEATVLFVFPQVTFLKLRNLPELTTFYPGTHTSEWPMLEKLEVYDCEKVKIFTSKNNEDGQLDISEIQSLFFVEKINPNLKQLTLSGIDNMMTQQGQFSKNLICRFKVLRIIYDKSANIPLRILQRCNNLKQLKLERSSYKEIFSYREDEKHIGKQDSKLDSVLQNLEVLKVRWCPRLLNVVPSSVSFQNLTVLTIVNCDGLAKLITSSTAKSLQQLTEMKIQGCKTMIEIVENEGDVAEDEIVFNKLKLLSLLNLGSLICFYCGNYTLKFPSLEELNMNGCPKMKTFSGGDLSTPILREVKENYWSNCWEGDLNTTIQKLYKNEVNSNLTLRGKDIMTIWHRQFSEYEFDKVKSLEVVNDESVNIPIEILQRFNNLEKLILNASSYKEVFSYEEDKKHVTQIKILEVFHCCNLITLMPSSTSFENLTTLKVCYCRGLRNLVTSSIAKSLARLQEMLIGECETMTEVVANEGDVEKDEIVFRKLRTLFLKHLKSLTSFCSRNYTFKFPSLEDLAVDECPKMKTFSEGVLSTPTLESVTLKSWNRFEQRWEGDLNTTIQQLYKMAVFPNLEALNLYSYESEKISWDIQLPTLKSSSYQNLISLILWNCEKLKYVFPSSIVRSFEQLQHLEICKCSVLKEIVAKEEAEAAVTFVFPQVTFLKLVQLPELTSFYSGKHTSEWPLLKYLEVRNCDKVKIFTLEYLNFKAQFDISEPRSLFLVEKVNPNLEVLKLSGIDSMMTWHGHFSENLLCGFKVLAIRIENSANIQLGIIQGLNLGKLILHDSSYKELFSSGENKKHAKRMFTQMKYLELWNLSNLKYIWKQDSKLDSFLQNLEVLRVRECEKLSNVVPTLASFQNLTVLTVENCNGLANLITSSTARSLVQLIEMKIEGCQMMVEIVENEGDVAEDEIVFNKLKLLSLENLKSLTCFYFGNCTLKFLSLEEVIVEDCPKMKTFSEGALSTPRLQKVLQGRWLNIEGCSEEELNTTIQQLHKKMVNSNLKELTLSGKDILQAQFPEHEFGEVKLLEVIKDESTNIPIEILQRFNNLEKLIVKVCLYNEIFSCGKKGKHIAGALSQLKILELRGLFHLKYLSKQDSYLEPILQNLEILEVEYCHNLITLVPSSSSFGNLKTLKVRHCDELINLVSSSIAKSLVQLEEMTIGQCEMMTEVVANEGDVVEDEILFSKLKKLSLESLESLKGFCSGNYTFKFPALIILFVRKCPKMKTFSEGVLTTPCLREVNSGQYGFENVLEGDLNTTIQQLYKMNGESFEKDLDQSWMRTADRIMQLCE